MGPRKFPVISWDRQLVRRVHDIVKRSNFPTPLDYELVIDQLCSQFREYERKPRAGLRKIVERALSLPAEENGNEAQQSQPSNNDGEAEGNEEECENGSSGDEEMADSEAVVPARTGNRMNTSIVATYRKAAAAAAAAASSSSSSNIPGTATSPLPPSTPPVSAMVDPPPTPAVLPSVPNAPPIPAPATPMSSGVVQTTQPHNNNNNNNNTTLSTAPVNHGRTTPATNVPPNPAPDLPASAPRNVSHRGSASKRARLSTTGSHLFRPLNNGNPPFGLVELSPNMRLDDIGGIDGVLQSIREIVQNPMTHPEVFYHLGTPLPRGVLLHGPPGSGKTMLANAIAAELMQYGVTFFRISATEVVSGMSGESESKIRDLFQAAKTHAPALIFIDEIDAISPKRDSSQRQMETRIVAQLFSSMDNLSEPMEPPKGTEQTEATANEGIVGFERPVMVIGATNRPDSIDSALRRTGRFDKEIVLGVPDDHARLRILEKMTSRLKLEGNIDLPAIVKLTPGYVGADLAALIKEAASVAVNRIFATVAPTCNNGLNETRLTLSEYVGPLSPQQLAPLAITMPDFTIAVSRVQPSAKREGFATVPDVTWDDVGALQDIRMELEMAIVEPIRNPQSFARLNVNAAAGCLLFGPPGCGKTLLAKAVAHESGANFISVKGPELLNKFVGESEKAVRRLFQRGRDSAPCVIFFDELDALCPRRGSDTNQATERVVNQLLTELDGLEQRRQVFVVAATNRPDIIDPAMLRPGRLDKLCYVPLPTPKQRYEILTTLTRQTPIAGDVNLQGIAMDPRANGFSGADLAALVREAAVACIKQRDLELIIKAKHFNAAFDSVLPSVSERDEKRYNAMRSKIRQSRAHLVEDDTVDDVSQHQRPNPPQQ